MWSDILKLTIFIALSFEFDVSSLPDTLFARLLVLINKAMKKLSFIIFVLIFCQITVLSQSCLPDGITFSTQAEIDSFQNNYPNCTEVDGDITIGEYGSDITNLNGLNVLTAIGGNLKIGGYFTPRAE